MGVERVIMGEAQKILSNLLNLLSRINSALDRDMIEIKSLPEPNRLAMIVSKPVLEDRREIQSYESRRSCRESSLNLR